MKQIIYKHATQQEPESYLEDWLNGYFPTPNDYWDWSYNSPYSWESPQEQDYFTFRDPSIYDRYDYTPRITYTEKTIDEEQPVPQQEEVKQDQSVSVPKVETTADQKPVESPKPIVDNGLYTYGWKGKWRPLTTNGRSFYQRYEFKSPLPIDYQYDGKPLVAMDIQELFKKEGLTSINGKKVRLNKDRKNPRTWGKNKGSWHRTIDKGTGLVTAWDVSIVNGTLKDYDALAKAMIDNKHIYSWLALKGFGIFDEVRGTSTDKTGPHFHIGPDSGAQTDFYGFIKQFAPHYLKRGGLVSRNTNTLKRFK